MAESKCGKMSITPLSSKIPDFLTAMVGSYNVQETGRNLYYLQDQTPQYKKSSSHHGYRQKSGYNFNDIPRLQNTTTHCREDWPAFHSYSALTQCLPMDSTHDNATHNTTCYPVSETHDTMYGRCSTPDFIQSVLQMEPQEVSPIGKQMTPTSHQFSTPSATPTSATPTSPVTSPHGSIWKSPGGREYMDSGYLSEDSLSSLCTSVYHTKSSTSEKEQPTQIPAFAQTFFLPQTPVSHHSNIKPLKGHVHHSDFTSQTLHSLHSDTKPLRVHAMHSDMAHSHFRDIKPQVAQTHQLNVNRDTIKATNSSNKVPQSCFRSSSFYNQTTSSSTPVSTFLKYDAISPVQVSCVSSKVSPSHFHTSFTTSEVSKLQSSDVSTTEEQLPLVAKNTKTKYPIKRKLSETDFQTETACSKRGRHNEPLNARAIHVMATWYNEHQDNPYPNKAEKQKMAAEGNIRVSQVKSWFANKRNRNNNTRPKVQKQQLQERLVTLCQSLAKDKAQVMDNSFILKQLTSLISSAEQSKN